jgi:antitoxin component YwqK of YwqJK toxin-antitoxin module
VMSNPLEVVLQQSVLKADTFDVFTLCKIKCVNKRFKAIVERMDVETLVNKDNVTLVYDLNGIKKKVVDKKYVNVVSTYKDNIRVSRTLVTKRTGDQFNQEYGRRVEGNIVKIYLGEFLYSVTPYQNGKKHGMSVKYYVGQTRVQALIPYVNGKKHGNVRTFGGNGTLRSETSYRYGKII